MLNRTRIIYSNDFTRDITLNRGRIGILDVIRSVQSLVLSFFGSSSHCNGVIIQSLHLFSLDVNLFNSSHPKQKLSDLIRILESRMLLGFHALRNIALATEFGVPVTLFVTFRVGLSNTNQERDSARNLGHIARDGPIEVHDFAISSKVVNRIAIGITVGSHVIDIHSHLRHVSIVPVSRTIESHSLHVVVILDTESLKIRGDRNKSIAANNNMAFRIGLRGHSCNLSRRKRIQKIESLSHCAPPPFCVTSTLLV